jgi:hypothetical protein
MSKNLSSFISEVRTGGLMRASRYTLSLNIPNILRPINPDMRKIMLFCSEVQLPGQSISTAPLRTYGEFREAPYEKLYEQISMTFYVDNDMMVKMFFDNWMNSIQNPDKKSFAYYKDYISDTFDIYVEDGRDDSRYRVTMREVFPKSIGAVQMGYDQKDIMKLTVNMICKNWVSDALPKSNEKDSSYLDIFSKQPSVNGRNVSEFFSGVSPESDSASENYFFNTGILGV